MNTEPDSLSPSKEAIPGPTLVRGPELGPALKRDMVLQRVTAARKRLPRVPSSALARLR
ncbi:MAG TPA: hypothetical protein VF009_11790 [Solirubrobacterales bacterium]